MLNVYPEDNLKEIMYRVPAATKEQLVRFLRKEVDTKAAGVLVDTFIHYHRFVYSKDGRYLQRHLAPIRRPETINAFLEAFWIIADFGSTDIKFIIEAEYPTQFVFTANDDSIYDLTFCPSYEIAKLGQIVRGYTQIKDENDIITHLAIVKDKAIVPRLKELGYDFFYIIDHSTNTVKMVEDV